MLGWRDLLWDEHLYAIRANDVVLSDKRCLGVTSMVCNQHLSSDSITYDTCLMGMPTGDGMLDAVSILFFSVQERTNVCVQVHSPAPPLPVAMVPFGSRPVSAFPHRGASSGSGRAPSPAVSPASWRCLAKPGKPEPETVHLAGSDWNSATRTCGTVCLGHSLQVFLMEP